jgi:hypothetical protein
MLLPYFFCRLPCSSRLSRWPSGSNIHPQMLAGSVGSLG